MLQALIYFRLSSHLFLHCIQNPLTSSLFEEVLHGRCLQCSQVLEVFELAAGSVVCLQGTKVWQR